MAKTTMNVSITHGLKELAQRQVEAGHFSTMSDYITHLIRNDVEKEKVRHLFDEQGFDLDQFIQAGIDSGPSKLSGPEIHEKARKRISKIAGKNKK